MLYEHYDSDDYFETIEYLQDNGGPEGAILTDYKLGLLKYFSKQEMLIKYCNMHTDDAYAQEWTATCFFGGYGVKKDTNKAKQLFLNILERINNSEIFFLGNKNPYQHNIDRHIKYVSCALGLIAYYEKNYNEAYDYLKSSIDFSFSKYLIARMNDKGYIFDSIIDSSQLYTDFFYTEYIKDFYSSVSKHFSWFINLAKEINNYACNVAGDFVIEDYELDFLKKNFLSFYSSKVHSGDIAVITTMIEYCYCYDIDRSYEYEELYIQALSSNINDIESLETLGYLYLFGHNDIINVYRTKMNYQNFELSYKYFLKAAELESPKAQYYLSCLFLHGIFVEKDKKTAISYLTKAAENGYKIAQYCLGVCYKSGYIVNIDVTKANNLFSLSATQNYGLAQFEYAKILEMNSEKEQNLELAIDYYKKASLSGIIEAYEKLEQLIMDPEEYFFPLMPVDITPIFLRASDDVFDLYY